MISIITCNIGYVTISLEIKVKEQQAVEFVSTRETEGYRLLYFECAQDTLAQSESSNTIYLSDLLYGRLILRAVIGQFQVRK